MRRSVGRMENHLIVTTYCEVLESENRKIAPLRIHIENEIPIGRGCGSSAAARLAGIALAVHFGHLRWKNDRIVGEASMREHHPDNASACWMGALTVARMANQVQAQVVEVKPKGKWPLLIAVPDAPLSTEQARRVLPFQYSRADAVTNIQNSMLLLAAFTQDRPDLFPALSKTAFISRIARRSHRCCLRSKNLPGIPGFSAQRSAEPDRRCWCFSIPRFRRRKRNNESPRTLPSAGLRPN